MAKEIQNLYELRVIYDWVIDHFEITTYISYGVTCEYQINDRRGMPITTSPQKLSDLEDVLINEYIPQIKIEEHINGGA